MEQEKTCWEKFATPHKPLHADVYPNDPLHCVEFTCWEASLAFRVYYDPKKGIDDDFLSGVIGRALSVCHGCKKMKPATDNADSSP